MRALSPAFVVFFFGCPSEVTLTEPPVVAVPDLAEASTTPEVEDGFPAFPRPCNDYRDASNAIDSVELRTSDSRRLLYLDISGAELIDADIMDEMTAWVRVYRIGESGEILGFAQDFGFLDLADRSTTLELGVDLADGESVSFGVALLPLRSRSGTDCTLGAGYYSLCATVERYFDDLEITDVTKGDVSIENWRDVNAFVCPD